MWKNITNVNKESQKKNTEKGTKRKSRSKGVFKFEEIEMWNDMDLDTEKKRRNV